MKPYNQKTTNLDRRHVVALGGVERNMLETVEVEK